MIDWVGRLDKVKICMRHVSAVRHERQDLSGSCLCNVYERHVTCDMRHVNDMRHERQDLSL